MIFYRQIIPETRELIRTTKELEMKRKQKKEKASWWKRGG